MIKTLYSLSILGFTLLWFLTGCTRHGEIPMHFSNCQQLASYIATLKLKNQSDQNGHIPASAPSANTDNINLQEKGVDEADPYRAGTHHLFIARASQVEVVDRSTLKHLGKLTMP